MAANVVDSVKVDFEDVLREWGEKMVTRIRKNMEDENVNATGETSASLEYLITDYGIQIVGAPYFAERTEVGRTETTKADPWDWRGQLTKWIKAKGLESKFGISDDRDLEKVVKAIYWKLNLEGSLKYREPDKQTDVYSTAVADGIDELAEQLLLRAGERLLGMADDMERVPGAKVGTTKAK